MRRIKLPTASTAVALLALFIALGGTGYAAAKLNGKNIKSKTITGKKFKKNTLTGTQIRESKVGKVPKVKVADSVASANGVSAAGSSGLFRSARVVDTSVIKLQKSASIGTAPLRTVLESGPFRVEMSCYGTGNQAGIRMRFTSSEPGSIVGDETLPSEQVKAPTNLSEQDDFLVGFIAPSGKTLMVDLYSGVNRLGADCVFLADGLASY
jgi:hypothetical protein